MKHEITDAGFLEIQADEHDGAELFALGELAGRAIKLHLNASVAGEAEGGPLVSFRIQPLVAPPPAMPDREGEWKWGGTAYLVIQMEGFSDEFTCRLLRDKRAAWLPTAQYSPDDGEWVYTGRPLSAFVDWGDIEEITDEPDNRD